MSRVLHLRIKAKDIRARSFKKTMFLSRDYIMNPIFVSGIGRSGTSALIKAMSCHKDVFTPNVLGEAPFIQKFIQFLVEFEESGENTKYNLKNYKVSEKEKNEAFSSLMCFLQNGIEIYESAEKYWVAKLTPTHTEFCKAKQIFEAPKAVGIIRNGVEVVNSAASFTGFSDLTFEQLCVRWKTSLDVTEYLGVEGGTCLVRHQDMVSETKSTFQHIFEKLGMSYDDSPSSFVETNIFNSSFDPRKSNTKDIMRIFQDRTNCWHDWTNEKQELFVSICDDKMKQYEFYRPYGKDDNCKVYTFDTMHGGNRKRHNTLIDQSSSPVKHSKKVSEMIQEYDTERLADYHCNVSTKYSYMFWENPKVFSTSILKFLQSKECLKTSKEMKSSHDRNASPLMRLSIFDHQLQDEILFGNKYFKFAFVRNPYVRLLSAYKSKIEKNLPAKYEILSVLHSENDKSKLDLQEQVSFEAFIDIVCSQEVVNMNSHWKIQKYHIHYDSIEYDFIGKLENVEQDLSFVTRKIFGSETKRLPISKNFTDSSSLLNNYYDRALARRVEEKYKSDFECFGYNSSILEIAA